MNRKSFRLCFCEILALLIFCLLFIVPIHAQNEGETADEDGLKNLYKVFQTEIKLPCGERNEAVAVGKKILELYSDDKDNQEVIRFVKYQTPKIEEQDRICKRNKLFDESYNTKDWRTVFAVGRQIINEEYRKQVVLDVTITLVSVGHRLTAYEKIDSYNDETVAFAKKVIEMIEAGARTQKCWGVFDCYETKEKTLAWMNFVIGYISYFRLNDKKEGIEYLYRATRYNAEFKYDAFVYQAVAIRYFEKEEVSVSTLDISEFITKATTFSNKRDESPSREELAKISEIRMLYKQLVNLYNLRYNLEENENVNSLPDYVLKLINRPLLDNSTEIETEKN